MKKIISIIMLATTFTFYSIKNVSAVDNVCLIEAAVVQEKLKQHDIQSKIITFKYVNNKKVIGHAVVLFRVGKKSYIWDSKNGSIPLKMNTDDCSILHQNLLKKHTVKNIIIF